MRARWLLGILGFLVLIAADARPVRLVRPAVGAVHLVTNEYAARQYDGVRSDDWLATSGSLFSAGGLLWSGRPDSREPDRTSSAGTNSSVLRVVSTRADYEDVEVSTSIWPVAFGGGPAREIDGVHLLLRYQSPYSLYAVSAVRRDGRLVIKKKVPGGPSNRGTYVTLASGRFPGPARGWRDVTARVTDLPGAVRIRLTVNGRPSLDVVDRGILGPPLTGFGRVGVRGDHCDFYLRGLKIRELPSANDTEWGATR